MSDAGAEGDQAVRDQVAAIVKGLVQARERIDVAAEEPACVFLPDPVQR